MPIGDWQFWAVTLVTIAAVFVLYRVFVPRRKGKRTSLTVGGEPVGRGRKPRKKDCGSDCGCG